MDEHKETFHEDKATSTGDEPIGMEESMAYAPLEDVHPGEIVKGKVVHIANDGVLVDVGAKSEGIVQLQDLSHRRIDKPTDVVALGDTIDVYVLGYEGEEGSLKLSKRRADETRAWDQLERWLESREVVEAPVTEVVKGGLVVDVGLRGFVPASHVSRGFVTDLEPYLGQTLSLRVIEIDRSKRRAILSRKVVVEEEARGAHELVWSSIEEGQIREGVVKSLTDFGAFVDLGGVDGLLHISEMSWGRIKHPSEVVQVGDPIKVKVLRLDRERQKISLGLRQVMGNPWDAVEEHYQVDEIYPGKVVRLAAFGAFVELEPGVDGLVHISQLADHRVQVPSEVVSVGDEVRVKVLKVDGHQKRISLSIREASYEAPTEGDSRETASDDAGTTIGERLAAYHAGDWEDEES